MRIRILAVLAALAPLGGCSREPAVPAPAAAPELAFKIILGANDTQPTRWDSSIEVAGGKLLSLAGWRFAKDDQVLADGRSWKCSTRHAVMFDPQLWWWPQAKHEPPADPNAKQPIGPMLANGVFLTLDGASEIRVTTASGNFSFSPASLPFGKPAVFLGGRAAVERAVPPLKLTAQDGREDDNPSVAIDAAGRAWIAWIGYANGQDQVFAGPLGGQPAPVGKPGVYFRTALARHNHDLWLVTSAREGDVWNLVASRYARGRWSDWEPLTATTGPKLFHRLALDSAGRLWLVWQGWAQGRSEIQTKYYNGSGWGEIATVSANQANAWEPALAAGPGGRVYFAWDAYDKGSYNIYLRVFDGKAYLPQQAVTASPRFHAHASVQCDAAGRPWVAWEEAGTNWGKDTGFWVRKNRGEALYEQRAVRTAVLDNGRWMEPAAAFPEGFHEQPQLVRDSEGKMWCYFRRRTPYIDEVWSPSMRRTRLQQYSQWEYLGSYFDGEAWSMPVSLPESSGRNDFRMAAAPAADGRIAVAWAADGRTWAKPYPGVKNNVFAGWIGSPAAAQPARLKPYAEAAAPGPAMHPREPQQLVEIQKVRLTAAAKTYRIVRGDMHRHTDISFDGDLDGSIWDFYRYTIDAAGFEYSALTDHNSGEDNEYFWWLIQKSNDLFYVPGRFTPVYAYERSLGFPNGHRNVVFAQRGVRTLARSQEEIAGTEGAARLYQYLRQNRGLAMSHTTATLMGTDWRDNDRELEPLVEIYQGDRTSAEYEGAPRGARGGDLLTQPGGYKPEGFVWNAWARGYKLGVQASSDHSSTHISYACLLVENTSREGILDATRKRHAYAATDNIILDFRLRDLTSGDHLMGEAFTTSSPPKILCRATGTAPIAKIDLIKNNKFIYSIAPNKPAAEFTYEDQEGRGESYYYIRLEQSDGQMAWSSPVWVKVE